MKLRKAISGVALAAVAVFAAPVESWAQVQIESFDSYGGGTVAAYADPSALITAGATEWTVDLTGATLGDYFGFTFNGLGTPPGSGLFDISSENTLQLDYTVNASGAFGTQAIVVLEDFFGNQNVYVAPNQPVGNHVYSIDLGSPSSGGSADLTDLAFFQVQTNSFGPGGSVPYSITLNDLSAVTVAPPDPKLITDFNNFNLGGTYASWDSANLVSGADSYTVQSTGFGGGFAAISPVVDASGDTHVELDVTVNADTSPNIIALLEDGDGTQHVYRWFSVPQGQQTLSFRMETLTNANAGESPNAINQANSYPGAAGSTPGLDLSTLTFFQLQVDDGDAYDISYNNFRVKNIPGGFDIDDDVDVSDLMVLQRGLSPNPNSLGDQAEWAANFGNVGEAIISPVSAVPEPGSAVLTCLAAATLASLRRRSH